LKKINCEGGDEKISKRKRKESKKQDKNILKH
jgi:hypothetical protein